MPASGLKVAPLSRRLAARFIDAVVFLTPTLGGGAAAAGLYMKYTKRTDRKLEWSPPTLTRPWRLALFGLSLALDARIRNWRSPGDRALGLRRVDVRTGGPVSIRSVVVRSVATHLFTQSTRLALRPWEKRRRQRFA